MFFRAKTLELGQTSEFLLKENMSIRLHNAADFDGRDADAFKAEMLEHQHSRQILTATFAA